EGFGPLAVASFNARNVEPSPTDEIVDTTIEVAAAGEALPHWIEAVLPPRDRGVWCVTVFDEEQTPARPQHATDLAQGSPRFRNGAPGPGHAPVGDARLGKRNGSRGGGDEFERNASRSDSGSRELPELT